VGASLLLHGIVLVGMGVGALPGSASGPGELVVYLAMPSAVAEKVSVTTAISGVETIPEIAQARSIPQVQQKPQEIMPQTAAEIMVPEEKLDPERLPEAEVDSLLNPEEVKVVTKPQAFIETSNSDNPNEIINGSEDGFATDYRSPITDHRPPLLAFAGDPAALGMIARDVLGPGLVGAEVLSLPEPVYPVLSRKRGEEGRVVIELEISAKGKVLKAEVANSSSYPRLDRAALAAVKAAAFSPATEYGRPVESERKVAYRFRLEEK